MEKNPDNELVQSMRQQYHKLLAVVMHMQKLDTVDVSAIEIQALMDRFDGSPNIIMRVKGSGTGEVIELRLAGAEEAAKALEEEQRSRSYDARVPMSGKAADPTVPGAPQPIDPATGQHKDHYILSDADRARGFVQPVRLSYKHLKCGVVTSMPQKIAETYAANPAFYGKTFCCGCGEYLPVGEAGDFVWIDPFTGATSDQKVGT